MFRIQKLLLAEFEEIYEPVLVENPFTLVDEYGRGLRQYYIALTPTKVLFGSDDFVNSDVSNCYYRGMDPAIESFALVSMLPLQAIRFHLYRSSGRELMRISVQGDNERPMIFEFGSHLYRSLFWNTWRDRIATIHLIEPKFQHISCSSPFSSTDVIVEDEVHRAIVHPRPPSYFTSCLSSNGSI